MKKLVSWLELLLMQYSNGQLRRQMRRIMIDNRTDDPAPMQSPDQIEDEPME